MSNYPLLFSPLRIGPCTLKNRIVSSGHDTVMVDDGRVTAQLVAYHEARAEGGVGLIIVQVAGVHETARYTSHVLMATHDSCIDGYAQLADVAHAHGAVIFGQLFHPGREVMESQDGSRPVAVAPSAVPNERFRVMPRALLVHEIEQIVEGYADAALRLARAGLDGVEVVASHGYLPSQFLNPHTNLRDDDYGGSPERRRRFLGDILRLVRTRVGPGIAVGIRISVDEHDPTGLDADIALATSAWLATEGLVDYVSVTTGTSAGLAGSDHIAPEMHFANGYTADLSKKMKSVVDVPVLVAGRINQPQEAERILASAHADACVMTRALICDPDLPRLALEGHDDEIRACVACNQACIGHFHAGYPISCIQHPETGRELTLGRRLPVAPSRRVLVVGGGPAGLKAAAVAAQRGHTVSLHEASARLGGQVLLAELVPGREEFGGVAMNLHREAERAGVEFVMNSPVTTELIGALRPERVIVATGARPYRPLLEILGQPVVLDAWQVLRGELPPRGLAVVVDWRGDWVGIGVARLLASRGYGVTLCVNGYAAGEGLQQYVRDAFLGALQRERIGVVPLVRLFGVDDDTVYLQHVITEEPIELAGVSAVVLACGHVSNADLVDSASRTGIQTVSVGDCMSPRSVEEAVLEGLVAARAI